jgi:5-methylcytosine-specific restriction enzyme subunit McrC
VTPLIPGEPLPGWQASRLNQRYVPALRLAEIVLRHLSAKVGEASVPVASFVVDMAKVFEDFVTTALQEATAGYPGRMEGQYPVNLAIGGGVPMRPDVVHLAGGRAQAVFDAKYKIETEHRGVPNADVYQMLAYCTALRLDRGYLIYAKGQGEALAHRIVNTDPAIEIIQYPLDLADSATGLLTQMDRLAFDALGHSRASVPAA